jgi:ubiquinone/menaquinone biosynthesis C-methylase UbiE
VTTNDDERARWNDEYWVRAWPRREVLTSSVTPDLVSALALRGSEKVLDVGCGGGRGTLAIASALTSGSVVGLDISEALLDLARHRAADHPHTSIEFQLGDAQTDGARGGPFDVVTSQFGVMFFDNPVAAFANLRSQVVPGGRLAFACWQSLDRNPWCVAPELAAYLPTAPPRPEGAAPVGPFVFGDEARVREILAASGWTSVDREAFERVVTIDEDVVFDPEELVVRGVGTVERAAAADAARHRLRPIARPDGQLDAPIAYQVFRAVNAI